MPAARSISTPNGAISPAPATRAASPSKAKSITPTAPVPAAWTSSKSKSAGGRKSGWPSRTFRRAAPKKFPSHETAARVAGSADGLQDNRSRGALRKRPGRGALALRLGQHADFRPGRPIHHRPFPLDGLQPQRADRLGERLLHSERDVPGLAAARLAPLHLPTPAG